jgi:tRNA dimethylallyltransferase
VTLPLFVIGGPTAVGKSALALALAPLLNAEIVNADSQQVYRGMDVGTGKPTLEERSIVPHHLYDVADPWEQLDAGQFTREADVRIAEIVARGRRVIVVGGTGLWIRALVRGLVDAPTRDHAFRKDLREEAARIGWQALHERLRAVDPVTAARIGATDPIRIERALEVHALSGLPLSELHARHQRLPPRYEAVSLGIDVPMPELEQRIQRRVRAMFAQGLLAETNRLAEDPRAVMRLDRIMGYREALMLARGELSRDEAMAATIKAQRQYAKRQKTWFRGEGHWRWLTESELSNPAALVAEIS